MLSKRIVAGPALLITFLLLFISYARPQPLAPLGLKEISSALWGGILDLKVNGNYAYATVPKGLLILDVSDLSQPVKLKEIPLGYSLGWRSVLAHKDNYLYVMPNSQDLLVFDISDPLNPAKVGEVLNLFQSDLFQTKLKGNLLAFLEGYYEERAVVFVDLSNPASPQLVSRLAYGYAQDFDFDNNLLFLTSEYGRGGVFDITNAAAPVFLDSLPSRSLTDIVVEDTLAYALTHGMTDSLQVWNVSNPIQLTRMAGIPTQLTNNETGASLTKLGSLLVWPNNNLEVFDVSDPLNPVSISVYDPQLGAWQRPSEILGTKIMLTGGALEVLDLANPSNPVCVSAGFGMGVNLVEVKGNLAVVGEVLFGAPATARLHTLDLTDPSVPVILGSLDFTGDIYLAERITFSGDYAYLLLTEPDGYAVIDLTDPTQPELVSIRGHCGDPICMAASETNLFIGGNGVYTLAPGCLNIYSLTNRANPQILTSLQTPGGTLSFTEVLVKDTLLLAGIGSIFIDPKYTDGIYVYNIKDPANPQLLSIYEDLVPFSLKLQNDTLFTINATFKNEIGNGYLSVLDISDPLSLKLIAETPFPMGCSPGCAHVAYRDGFVFASDRNNLRLYDFSDRTNLRHLADFPVNGGAVSFDFVNNTFVLANSNSLTLYSFDFSQPRGDLNHDSDVDLQDIIFLVNYLFGKPGNWQPYPVSVADANCDGKVSLVDVIQMVNFIFKGVPLPC